MQNLCLNISYAIFKLSFGLQYSGRVQLGLVQQETAVCRMRYQDNLGRLPFTSFPFSLLQYHCSEWFVFSELLVLTGETFFLYCNKVYGLH